MSTSPDSNGGSTGTGYRSRFGSSAASSTSPPDLAFDPLGLDIDMDADILHAQASTPLVYADMMQPPPPPPPAMGSIPDTSQQPPSTAPPPASAPAPAPAPDAERRSRFWTKKAHKKSRGGCVICKQRKVKCDEIKPSCTNCTLRADTCVYKENAAKTQASDAAPSALRSSASTVAFSTPRRTLAVRSQTPGAAFFSSILPDTPDVVFDERIALDADQSAWARPGGLDNPDFDFATPLVVREPILNPLPTAADDSKLKLLWFYTTYTASSFSFDNLVRGYTGRTTEIMRSAVVQLAFQNPFLMDSIFALAALHEVNQRPSSTSADWMRALQLKQKSFVGYHNAIVAADPATFPALLANSLILCGLASQNFRDPDAPDLYISEWMVVWKGIGIIVDLISVQKLVQSGIHSIFFRPAIDLNTAAASVPNNLLFMISSIPAADPDRADTEDYYDCLKHLGAMYADLPGGMNAIMQLRIITVATFLPARYIELLRMRRVRALVIVAYFAMFLKLIPGTWWTANIGQRTLLDLRRHLSDHPSLRASPSAPLYAALLAKPFAAIAIDDTRLLARHILDDPAWEPNVPSTDEVDSQVDSLTWVDNAGRRVVMEPAHDRMFVEEYEGAPRQVPYYDKTERPEAMGMETPPSGGRGSPETAWLTQT